MEWILSWEVSSVVVVLLISVALAVLALNDFKIAKSCFLFAAVWAVASVFMWVDRSTGDAIRQIGTGGISLLFIALLLVVAFRYADRKEGEQAQQQQIFSEEFAKQVIQEFRKVNIETAQTGESAEEAESVPYGEGFVQLEDRSIAIESPDDLARVAQGDLRVGEIIKVKFTVANRGPRPVLDCQSWGLIVCVDPTKNPGKQLRDVMLQGVKVGYEQFKKSGNALGAGKEVFNFAQSTPLTKADLDGVKEGTLRVHVLLSGAWSDSKGHPFYWTNAEWTNWPQVPMPASFWKGA
jgi:hypothetical protein